MTADPSGDTRVLTPRQQWLVESLLYIVTIVLTMQMVAGPEPASVWWPPTGALLGWLLLRPRSDWPVVLAMTASVRVLAGFAYGVPLLPTVGFMLGALLSVSLAALVIRRLTGSRALLAEPRDVLTLAFASVVLIGPLTASLVVFVLAVTGSPAPSLILWVQWALGDAIGGFLVSGVVLTASGALAWWHEARARARAELALVMVATLFVVIYVELTPPALVDARRPMLALIVVPAVWAALRFGLFAASWVQFLVALGASYGLAHGIGILSLIPTDADRRLLVIQAWFIIASAGVMLIAASFESQKRAVARARSSEAQFRRLVDDAPVALLVERLVETSRPYLNPRLVALLGPSPATGGLDAWWTRAGATPEFRAALTQAGAAGASGTVTPLMNDLVGSDGTVRHVELNMSVVGERRITAFTDLTDRLRLEGELRQAHKLEALGTLAGGVAHDFNNILASVLGNLDLARRALPASGGEESAAFLGEVERAGRRAAALVRQILTFSRREEQVRRVVVLSPVLHEAVELLRGVAGPAVRVVVQEAADVPRVLGDVTQLHQLLVNLGTNGLHAMRGTGGTLTIALSGVTVTAADVRRRAELREGRHARIVVSDTGHGMAPETLERIFEPFFTTKPMGTGTGLGLAVVHGVVGAHGGAIAARSTVGEGSSFEVLLPAVTTPVSVDVVSDERAPELRGLRVLVVDDEPTLVNIAMRTLTRAGCAVRCALDGASALEALREDPRAVDVLVTDLTMPGMSGLELAVAACELRADLPVLLVSGYSAMLTVDEVQAHGVAAILEKPYAPDELARAVFAVAAGGSPQASSHR